MRKFYYSDNFGRSRTWDLEKKCNDSKYECFYCHGYGVKQIGSPEGDFTEKCDECNGTGFRQVTISLKEYDELKGMI